MEMIGSTVVLLLLVSLCILYSSSQIDQSLLPATTASSTGQGPANGGRGEDLQSPPPLLIGRGRVCNVLDYGARATGTDFDTHALQKAIDDCARGDGGLVYVPPGDYLTATLYLRSNIVLYIERNATIYGSPNQSDYPSESQRWYVILAESVDNVQITGGGTVDGQAEKFVVRYDTRKNIMVSWNTTGDCKGDECRPRLVGFLDSRNVHVKDVYLHQPAYWCIAAMYWLSESKSSGISIYQITMALSLPIIRVFSTAILIPEISQGSESYHDYRPGCRGLIPHSSSGKFVEYTELVTLEDVTVVSISERIGLSLRFAPGFSTLRSDGESVIGELRGEVFMPVGYKYRIVPTDGLFYRVGYTQADVTLDNQIELSTSEWTVYRFPKGCIMHLDSE
ncbi:hypothetical protein R1flu_008764 [Riccia fluitans]|uniref:Rhamnogalacturonase A/B/Epimerase-like pectate lyase domain-containing protein n=1 Tax=Riccia fluitans TaxID=41844 RepID=A0ABD1XE75_9MARC